MNVLPQAHEIDAIIFDFGGVLFDIEYDTPVREFKKLGLDDFSKIYAQSAQSELFDRLETGTISNENFLLDIQKVIPTQPDLAKVLAAWNSILTGIPKGRIDQIHQLKPKYRTFLLSNTNAIHVEEFEKMVDAEMGIDYFKSAFEKVYYSNVIGIKKPYPSTYLEVCSWNDLNPSTTLFIDDSVQHVEGARAAGLHAYHIDVTKEDIRNLFKNW
ncbi:MAG: HAD family hydrolase [Flavobacteriales bacterium]